MRSLDVARKPVDAAVARSLPTTQHGRERVAGPVTLVENGKPLLVLTHLPVPLELRQACHAIKAPTHTRTNGLTTTSRAFGTVTRNIIRGDYCRSADVAFKHPREYAALAEHGRRLSEVYREFAPDTWREHSDRAASVPRGYRLRDTPFTSGNLNKNSSLAYHFDRGNAPGVWSAMTVLRERVDGACLVLPEFDVSLELPDGACLLFDGQKTLHGLTPAVGSGYRYSIVYFSLYEAWKCLPPDEELQRIKQKTTERNRARLGRNFYAGAKPELSKLAKSRAR